MRIKSIDRLYGGEILAESVLTEKKDVLVPKGTSLKKEYISLLKSLGFEYLMIEDTYEKYENPHRLLPKKKVEYYVERVQKILEGHMYSGKSSLKVMEPLANEIVDNMEQLPNDMVFDIVERNADLYEHTIMVTLLSVWVACRLNLDRKTKYAIAVGGLLHDLGLRYIRTSYIDCDFSKYSSNELFEYKKHTILAYSVLEEEKWIPEMSKKMILSHHERIDGSGFPLKQMSHCIGCDIIQVCDTLDCFISGMECKRITVQEALNYMNNSAGILFNREIVDIIAETVATYPVGTLIKTNKEKEGVVISQTNDANNPIILIIDQNMNYMESKCEYNLKKDKNISILQVV